MRAASIAASSIFLSIIALSHAIARKEENSLVGPYEAESNNLMYWDLTGSAQLGGSYIRLTTDEPDKQGSIWNNFPCFSNNWELQAQFHIHGKGVHLYGDGMAIWYVRDILHSGHVFGSKDYFSGLGVFIDTFENAEEPHNHRHPYISAVVNNGTLVYDHDEDGTAYQIGGCHVPVRNLAVPPKIAISYINDNLAVYVDFEGVGQWKLCFKALGVHLPTGYHFGISAETTDVSDNHDLIYVTTLSFDPDDKEWVDKGELIPYAEHVLLPKHPQEEEEKIPDEEELQKVEHKREARDTDEKEHKRDAKDTDEKEHKRKAREADEKKQADTSSKTEESSSSSTSLLRKCIYVIGAIIIILVLRSVYRKYNERRKERLQKLY